MSAPGWDNFWKDQKRSFYAVMQIATGYFTRQLLSRKLVKSGHEVLDYGCGPGFVADELVAQNISITGVDINEFFIETCRKNHPAGTFIHITTDTGVNKKLLYDQLKEKQFDCLILLSVVQYLEQTGDVNDIVALLRDYLKRDGQLIIADVIDDHTSSARDAIALFKLCLKKGRVGAFIGFIGYLLFSDYRKFSKSTQLLKLPEQAIREIAAQNNLVYKKVTGLTLHPTRCNYIFYLPD